MTQTTPEARAAMLVAPAVAQGGRQRRWLEPPMRSAEAPSVVCGAIALTGITDNAAVLRSRAEAKALHPLRLRPGDLAPTRAAAPGFRFL